MNPFDYEITKANRKPNKLVNAITPSYGGSDSIPHEYDYESFINAFRSWVYIACSKNAGAVASQKLRLYFASESNSKVRGYNSRGIENEELIRLKAQTNLPSVRRATKIHEITDHPFLDLMNSVNPFMNIFDLFELTTLHQDLTGNSYWYILDNKLGVPKEIWPMMPQDVKIIPDSKTFISGYKQSKNGLFAQTEGVFFPEKEVIHFKHVSPKSYYYGYSPVWAVKDAYNVGMGMYDYEKALFENGGTLSGVFQTEADLSEFEFERLKEEIKQMFGGAKNAGKAPLLSNGVTYNPYGLPPKEMSFLKGRNSLKEEVVNSMGQNLAMYSQEANRSNSDNAFAEFARNAVRPRLLKIEQKINEKIMPRYDNRLFVAFDNPIPENLEHQLNERVKNILTGVTSINEEREKIFLGPIKGLELPIIPANMMTVEQLLNNAKVPPEAKPVPEKDEPEEKPEPEESKN